MVGESIDLDVVLDQNAVLQHCHARAVDHLSLDDRWSRPFYVRLHIAELVGGGDITAARRNFDIAVSHDPRGSATVLASPMRKILSVEKNNRIRWGIRTGPARRDDSGLRLRSREGPRLLRLGSRGGE